MIAESQSFRRQVLWFTTLVSRGENLPPLYRALTEAGAVKVVKRDGPWAKAKPLYCSTFMDDDQRRCFITRKR